MKNYAEKMTYKEQLEAIEELKEKARWARYRNEICGKSPRENQEIYRLSQKYGDYKKAHEIWIEKDV